MKFISTPEERFQNLEGYNFEPHYEVVDGMKMHYVKEGNNSNEVVLMLHGEPSWSYLYRKMIPIVAGAGYTVIAPDLIGFGKSDKPTNRNDYTYQSHLDWMTAFIKQLDLKNLTLVCQDWGGLIGLRLAVENENRFKRIVAGNTTLPNGLAPMNEAFSKWKEFSQTVPELPVAGIIKGATVTKLSSEVLRAYDAPFPSEEYKEGARIFPALVPATPEDPQAEANQKAWKVLSQWKKPFLTAFSDSDPIMSGLEKPFQKIVPGAQGQNHVIIKGAGHFLQEDKGEEFAEHIVNFIRNTQ